MEEKIKVLSLIPVKKEVKKPEGAMSVQDYIEEMAPGLYTFSKVYIGDAIETVDRLRPEIIWLQQEASVDCTELLKEIKRIHPSAAVFVMLVGVCDDEQETANTYLALGAYKCYFIPPMLLDELVHDMHVAMNIE